MKSSPPDSRGVQRKSILEFEGDFFQHNVSHYRLKGHLGSQLQYGLEELSRWIRIFCSGRFVWFLISVQLTCFHRLLCDHARAEAQRKYAYASLKVVDQSISLLKEELRGSPVPQILGVADDWSVYDRINEEKFWIEFIVTRGIPMGLLRKSTSISLRPKSDT